MIYKKVVSDAEFAAWAESCKPCTYCGAKFIGPVCACEKRLLQRPIPGAIDQQFTLALSNKRPRRGV